MDVPGERLHKLGGDLPDHGSIWVGQRPSLRAVQRYARPWAVAPWCASSAPRADRVE